MDTPSSVAPVHSTATPGADTTATLAADATANSIAATTAGSAPPSARERATNLAFRRAQAASGIALTMFASVHLLNTMLAAIPGAYDPFQRLVRRAYQSPVIEVLLVFLPLLVHVVAGVRAFVKRRSRTADAPLRTRLHRYAAWYLLLVITGHVIATRGASLVYGVHPEFAGLQFSTAWLPWVFIPYYAVFGVAGVYHVAHGVPIALGVLKRRVPSALTRPSTFWSVVAIGALAALLGVAGIAGWLYASDVDPFASDYAQLYRDMGSSPYVPDIPAPRAHDAGR